ASLVVNLLRTTYLDSTALSVLTTAQKQAREAGGNLGLVYDQPQIEKIFTITGLHRVFPIFRTETEAVNTPRSWIVAVPPKRTHLRVDQPPHALPCLPLDPPHVDVGDPKA